MDQQGSNSQRSANLAAIITFVGIVVVLLLIAVLNAPTQGGPRVMSSAGAYLSAVFGNALPYLGVIAILAVGLGFVAARTVRREWIYPRRRRQMLAGYAFLSPYLLVTLTFTVGVVLFALYISFTSYDIFTAPEWVGLKHYFEAFSQREFLQALHNVLWYAALVVPLQTAAAILMAVLLNAPVKFRQFFRTLFYAPSVTSSVVITLIFMWFYLKTGYINLVFESLLGIVGAEWQAIDWLRDPRGLMQIILAPFGVEIPSDQWYLRGPSIAWMAIMFQNIFTTAPTFMVMFLTALQDINPALYEAASIDGANGWQRFWSVTLPLLRPVILLVVVLGTIGTLQVFDQVYLATSGGPLGTTTTPVYQVYVEALGQQGPIHMGYGAALAFIVAVIIFIFTYVQRRFIERGTEMY